VFKLAAQAQKGKKVSYPFEYISNAPALMQMKGKGKSIDEFTNSVDAID